MRQVVEALTIEDPWMRVNGDVRLGRRRPIDLLREGRNRRGEAARLWRTWCSLNFTTPSGAIRPPKWLVEVQRMHVPDTCKSGNRKPHFTLFLSQDDNALSLSRFLAGDRDRLGGIDPEKEPYRSKLKNSNIVVIDLTKLASDGSFNHAKFAESREVARLIVLVASRSPEQMSRSANAGSRRQRHGRGTISGPSHLFRKVSASAMPAALAMPWPSGPVVVSMPAGRVELRGSR